MTYAAMGSAVNYIGQMVVAVAHDLTPRVTAYPFFKGFQTKFSNPPTALIAQGYGIKLNPAKNIVGISQNSNPRFSIYYWNQGFGARASTVNFSLGSFINDIAFTKESNTVFLTNGGNSPYISAYPLSYGTVGTRYADPATPPTNSAYSVAVTPQSDAVAVGHTSAPRISAYPWSFAGGFGTKYTNPTSYLAAGSTTGVDFNQLGNTIIMQASTGIGIYAYPWNSSTGFGTKYADPATLPSVGGFAGIKFSPSGNDILYGGDTSPYLAAYPWNNPGFGTKYASPVTVITSSVTGSDFSPEGLDIVASSIGTPFVHAYEFRSGVGFGNKYANPAVLPNGQGNYVSFN